VTVRPTLPPEGAEPTRLLALPGTAVESHHRDTVVAMLEAVDPDLVVATPPRAGTVGAAVPRRAEIPVLAPERGSLPDAVHTGDEDVLVATVPTTAQDLDAAEVRGRGQRGRREEPGGTPDEEHRVCLTPRVTLEVDPYERETSIDGLDGYTDQLPEGWLVGDTTHCSTGLRAGYRTTTRVDGEPVSLVGIGRTEASLGVGATDDGPAPTLVEVYANGAVGTETVDPGAFGLRGVPGIGEKRARTLRRAGFSTPRDVVDGPARELADLPGLGRSSATGIRAAAEARTRGTVVATGDDSLPRGDPVFVDIETDGREPSCAWLIGVLDGGPEDGHYMPFMQSEPGDTGHLESFLHWLDANAGGRPLVAWYGYQFDFPVLRDRIQQQYPGHLERWDDRYQFDLLWWARDKNGGNVALPGRSNELEPVAEGLGWEPGTNGIDGGVVARVYTAYRRAWLSADEPRTVAEPDWDRLAAYCEDDVRALATVYEACEAAARREPGTTREADSGTQGALSDFT
jgi:uncharacterized protein YprB with RNaseH-like and TPR domain